MPSQSTSPRRARTLLAVLAATGLLVASADVATYAATGDSFVLGHVNKAGRTSVLNNTGSGPTLELRGDGAPLAVASSKRVVHLNADPVDGRDAADLTTRAVRYGVPFIAATKTFNADVAGLADGVYLVSYDVVASMTSPGDAIACNITLVDQVPFSTAVSYGVARGPFSQANASGVVDTRQGDVQLQCFAPTNFTVEADESFESYVVFTRVGGLDDGGALVAAD